MTRALNPSPGSSFPLGATCHPDSVNFSLYSRTAQGVILEFYDHPEDRRPARSITLDPRCNRTFHYWHVNVPGVKPGQLYGYRVTGPGRSRDNLLLDPYGRSLVIPPGYDRKAASRHGADGATAMKSRVTDVCCYDWQQDSHPRTPFVQTVIYELHVGGFTGHPSSGVPRELRGTYLGLVEKIPYLVELGVTAVELLPVFCFDAQDAPDGLTNVWGYSPVSFFAPHPGYAASGESIDEFRDMVRLFHRAGLEVILDVVYNHTAEGGADGPTISFRGIEDNVYYLRDAHGDYHDFSGCGNTLNANHSVVRRLILDSLRYWVSEMHVDGFRFDLASILARDENGAPLANPPVLWEIETDPVLAGTKLIAEAWDAAGLYQVGTFIGDRWREWNGRFRDDVRSFIKGDQGTVQTFASRILASPDIYEREEREPTQSINFVTCHDGFTLNDLVSYNNKHNLANAELNHDGSNDNRSWNCGVEGPSDDPTIEALRNRQVKNFLAITLLSMGVPMLLMGDETRRTQQGNNNAYCQDNELSQMDWNLLERHRDVHRFVRELIAFRRGLEPLTEQMGLTLRQVLERSHIAWHGIRLGHPDWGEGSHSLAVTLDLREHRLHLIANAYWEPLDFELPADCVWTRKLDTALASPHDVEHGQGPPVKATSYTAGPRSLVLLVARPCSSPTITVTA